MTLRIRVIAVVDVVVARCLIYRSSLLCLLPIVYKLYRNYIQYEILRAAISSIAVTVCERLVFKLFVQLC